MKRKFWVKVERIDEYEIEIDESIIGKEFMDNYSKYFSEIDSLKGHAENIALLKARFGEGFIEGYGDCMVNGKLPFMVEEDKVNKGININVISEDDFNDMYVQAEEII